MEDVSATQLLLLSALLFLLPCSAYDACDELDRDDLLSLPFKAPLNWSASTDCCLCDGIICDPLYHIRVIRLWLPKRGLSGVVSSAVTNLTRLTHLNINLQSQQQQLFQVNTLEQRQPSSLPNCKILSSLNLRVNNLTGELSAFKFSTLQCLATLDLGNNNFIGELPQSLYSCKSLTAIRYGSNQLTGEMSPGVVALESLSFLSISAYNLRNAAGAIRILKGCKNLTTLVLFMNFLNEPFPDDKSLGDPVGFQSLEVFSLGACQFTRQIPTWLAMLKKIKQILVVKAFNQYLQIL